MDFDKARSFVYRTARPLDIERWKYLFEDGSQENVLHILQEYQNEDGGFGHGLELDCWNPKSSPIQTWTATEIIREVHLEDRTHPVIQGILRYLFSGDHFDGHIWANTIASNNEYPHASWWNYDSNEASSYNPTASLIGFILYYAEKDSSEYAFAVRLLKEAYAYLKTEVPMESMHTTACFVDLYETCCRCSVMEIDQEEFKNLLNKQISYVLTKDTSIWFTDYVCKPSQFIKHPNSEFYAAHAELCAFERDFISQTQLETGSWEITWEWDSFPEEWHIAKNWWKADMIIRNVCFYKAFERV